MSDFSQIDVTFGENFATARRAQGMSQEFVVDELGRRGFPLHVTAIGKIERGERRVTIGEAAAIASILGMPLDALTGSQPLEVLTAAAVAETSRNMLRERLHRYVDALAEFAKANDRWLEGRPDGERETEEANIEKSRFESPAALALEATEAFLQRARSGSAGKTLATLSKQLDNEAQFIRYARDQRG